MPASITAQDVEMNARPILAAAVPYICNNLSVMEFTDSIRECQYFASRVEILNHTMKSITSSNENSKDRGALQIGGCLLCMFSTTDLEIRDVPFPKKGIILHQFALILLGFCLKT